MAKNTAEIPLYPYTDTFYDGEDNVHYGAKHNDILYVLSSNGDIKHNIPVRYKTEFRLRTKYS